MAEYNRYREEENASTKDAMDKDLSKEIKDSLDQNEINEEEKECKENSSDKIDNFENLDNSDKADKKDKKQIKKLKERIEELEKENADLKNANLIVKADALNFQKRIEAEKDSLVKYGNQKLLEKLVGELDLFDKVVSMPTNDPVLKNYLIGFEMINNNFKNILEGEGVKKIKVNVGDKFDPKYHHVLQTAWDENYEENVILAELRGGYTYKDRVLVTSLVKVNKKEENTEENK